MKGRSHNNRIISKQENVTICTTKNSEYYKGLFLKSKLLIARKLNEIDDCLDSARLPITYQRSQQPEQTQSKWRDWNIKKFFQLKSTKK